jgi:hypothetical protein
VALKPPHIAKIRRVYAAANTSRRGAVTWRLLLISKSVSRRRSSRPVTPGKQTRDDKNDRFHIATQLQLIIDRLKACTTREQTYVALLPRCG